MSETTPRLTVKVENETPLDVLDLTASFSALADEYSRYSGEEEVRLYVERISEGSVIAELVAIAKGTIVAGSPLVPLAFDAIAPFLGHWSGLLHALASYGRDAAKDAETRRADKRSLQNARKFVQPALNGNSINVQGDINIAHMQVNVSPERAGDIDRTAKHLLAGPLPDEQRFENLPLALYQVRDARAGDMGFIDSFGPKPKRLTFASEAVKNAVLHAEASPFDVFFFVSGVVRTAGGEVASYHIEKIDGITAKDAA